MVPAGVAALEVAAVVLQPGAPPLGRGGPAFVFQEAVAVSFRQVQDAVVAAAGAFGGEGGGNTVKHGHGVQPPRHQQEPLPGQRLPGRSVLMLGSSAAAAWMHPSRGSNGPGALDRGRPGVGTRIPPGRLRPVSTALGRFGWRPWETPNLIGLPYRPGSRLERSLASGKAVPQAAWGGHPSLVIGGRHDRVQSGSARFHPLWPVQGNENRCTVQYRADPKLNQIGYGHGEGHSSEHYSLIFVATRL